MQQVRAESVWGSLGLADEINCMFDFSYEYTSDTVQEKLSLAARFGESIFFNGPSKKEYQAIVKGLAVKNSINMEEEELLLEANKWELSHGGMSGRTAQQFIDHLLGCRQ